MIRMNADRGGEGLSPIGIDYRLKHRVAIIRCGRLPTRSSALHDPLTDEVQNFRRDRLADLSVFVRQARLAMLEQMVKPGELLDGNCLVSVKGQSLLDDGEICRGGYLHIFTSLYGEHGALHAGKHWDWVVAQEVAHPRCS